MPKRELSVEENSEYAPIELPRFILSLGRRLCGVWIKAKSERNILRKISSWIVEGGLKPIFVHFQKMGDRYEIIRIFMDYTDSVISPEKIKAELSSVKDVVDVKVFAPEVEGFLVDVFSHPIQVAGLRAVIFRKPVYEGLLRNLRERFSSGGEAFLYYIGFEAAREGCKAHKEIARQLRIVDPLEVLKQISINFFKCVGFGTIEVIEYKPKPLQLTMRVHDSFECELGLGSGKPYSHFIRGLIAGAVTELFEIPVTVTETKCLATGHPYCEFIIKPENP